LAHARPADSARGFRGRCSGQERRHVLAAHGLRSSNSCALRWRARLLDATGVHQTDSEASAYRQQECDGPIQGGPALGSRLGRPWFQRTARRPRAHDRRCPRAPESRPVSLGVARCLAELFPDALHHGQATGSQARFRHAVLARARHWRSPPALARPFTLN